MSKGVSSSIRGHINETNHVTSSDNFCILDKASNELDLLVHEGLFVLRDRPMLNQQNSFILLVLLMLLDFLFTDLFGFLI